MPVILPYVNSNRLVTLSNTANLATAVVMPEYQGAQCCAIYAVTSAAKFAHEGEDAVAIGNHAYPVNQDADLVLTWDGKPPPAELRRYAHTIELVAVPTDGDTVEIDDGEGNAVTFEWDPSGDGAGDVDVNVSSTSDGATNLVAAILASALTCVSAVDPADTSKVAVIGTSTAEVQVTITESVSGKVTVTRHGNRRKIFYLGSSTSDQAVHVASLPHPSS